MTRFRGRPPRSPLSLRDQTLTRRERGEGSGRALDRDRQRGEAGADEDGRTDRAAGAASTSAGKLNGGLGTRRLERPHRDG